MPQEVIIKASILEKGRRLFVTGILALSILLMATSLFIQNYYRQQTYVKWLEGKLSATRDPSEEVTSARRAIQQVIGLHEANLLFLEALVRLHEVVPKEIYFTELNLTKDHRFQIQGRAESMTSVFDFVNTLKSLSLFQGIETKRLTKRISDNKEVVDFEIDSVLSDQKGVFPAEAARPIR